SLKAWRPPVFVFGSFRYAVRPTDSYGIDVRWISGGAGGGAVLVPFTAPVRFEADVEFVVQQVHASMAAEAYSKWAFGARLGLDAAWTPGDHFGAFAGIEGSVQSSRSSESAIIVGTTTVATQRRFGFAVCAGPRLRF